MSSPKYSEHLDNRNARRRAVDGREDRNLRPITDPMPLADQKADGQQRGSEALAHAIQDQVWSHVAAAFGNGTEGTTIVPWLVDSDQRPPRSDNRYEQPC